MLEILIKKLLTKTINNFICYLIYHEFNLLFIIVEWNKKQYINIFNLPIQVQ